MIGLSDRSTSASARSIETPSSASQCNVGNRAKPRIKGIAAGIALSDLVIQAASSRTDILASNAKPTLQLVRRPPGGMRYAVAVRQEMLFGRHESVELAFVSGRGRRPMNPGEAPSATLWMRAASGLEVLTGARARRRAVALGAASLRFRLEPCGRGDGPHRGARHALSRRGLLAARRRRRKRAGARAAARAERACGALSR